MLERDGASQSQRHLSDLDPESVGIDERGIKDWLAFAHAYSQELAYYNLDNQPSGDWSGFLNPENLDGEKLSAQWQEIERFLTEPERFDDAGIHRRPHFVLFLAFLHLLRLSQRRLNRLTREHLDFYYRKFLSLERQAAQPDRVNILAVLSPGVAQALLPQGTLLDAGKDSLGEGLFYRTDEKLTVNRAQVKSLYSVFVDKKVTGIRQAREECAKVNEDPLLAMFEIVYGEPTAGDRLPPYPPKQTLDSDFLGKLGDLVEFVGDGLFLGLQEFRNLMRLKNSRNQSASDDWKLINDTLEIIGKAEIGPGFTITTQSPGLWDFDANLKRALNGKTLDFDSLPGGLKSMEDLYGQKSRDDVQSFIKNKLHLELDNFTKLMEKKMEVDRDWRIVNGLLELAGQLRLKNTDFRLANPANSPDFDQNFQAALDKPDFSRFALLFSSGNTDLDRFNTALQQVETYFYCSLEDFALLMEVGTREKQTDSSKKPTPAEWDRVYAVLASAYARKVYAGRCKKLSDLIGDGKRPQKDRLEAMLRLSLGETVLAADELLRRLELYWPEEYGKALEQIKNGMKDEGASDFGKEDVVAGLELAWRNREGIEPVAQKEEWLNLYATEDATSVKVADLSGTPRWRTFGQGRQVPGKDQPPAPLLGWAIASPMFCLSQGQRKVVLTLAFRADSFNQDKIGAFLEKPENYPFQVEASGEKGWVVPDSVQIESIAYTPPPGSPPSQVPLQALRLTLGFGVSSPPIAALPGAESPWPLIRLLLRSVWKDDVRGGGYATPYSLFQSLALERVLIEASVVGLKDLRLENDNGPVQAGKPFEPFGFSPAAGSGFRFVHPELVVKRLDRLETNLEWMKVPAANLVTHYKNYPAVSANDSFTAKISLVDHQLNIKLVGEAALFDADDAGAAHKISLLDIPAKIQASRPGYAYVPEFAPFGLADPASWPRYWCWELNAPDFQHGAYAQVAAAKSVALATSIAKGEKPNAVDYQVNPPYTPKLKSFSVDYGCSVEIVMAPNDPQGYGKSEERIYYRQAFGVAEIQPEQDTGLYCFLPAYGYEGELYIGLEGVAAPQNLALLFQMAEGSANPDLEPQPVEWSYLSSNRWVSLRDGGILADSTHGLIESGIIKFHLPEAQSNTLLPANRYWLRAAVAQHCDSVCDTVDILAQAVSATWIDRGNAPDHLSQPLPPKTITKTADSVPGIATISQPYTSFGGKPGEQDALFDTRVSERLRHKQRALTLWDYEHLILEQFPGIYKVKCIPASSMEPGNLGKVDIIVIPDIRNQLPFDPFEPKATASQLAEITDFLESHISPLAEIKVKNAYYVPVRVRVAVRFMPGCDPGFYKIRLNDDLNRFLSPWAYKESNKESKDVVIGGKLYANAIVDFLERRPYVDYVAELKLFKNEDGLSFEPVDNTGDAFGYRVQADRPDGVLVAYHQHDIDLITETRFEDEKFIGIGYMKIELDFVVN